MQRVTLLGRWWIIVTMGCLVAWGGLSLAQEPNQIGYWRTQFQELTPDADARVARAQTILGNWCEQPGRGVGSPRVSLSSKRHLGG